MKSKTSLFNKAVFKRNMTGYPGLWAGFLLFYFVSMPLLVFMSLSNSWYLNDLTGEELLVWKVHEMIQDAWVMDLYVPVIAVAAVVAAMCMFSYLFTSRNANMMHTYPVNRLSLFCTNYISGILYLILPEAAGMIMALLAGAYKGAVTGTVVHYYLYWLVMAVTVSIFFFSMAVCVLMVSGNIVAVPVFYGILNFLYTGCVLIVDSMVSILCYGLVEGWGLRTGKGDVLTPILYMRTYIGVSDISADNGDWNWQYSAYGGKVLLGYFMAALVLTAIAVVIYQKKHVETAGDVITVGWLKPIFRWGAAACTASLGALFLSGIFFGDFSASFVIGCVAVVGVLAFFTAQMVIERTVRVFTKKRIVECVIYSVCMCAVYIAVDVDIFGIESRIPDEEDIQAIAVEGSLELYTEDENKEWVLDIHKQIIESKAEFEQAGQDPETESSYIHIIYFLKNGTSMTRAYSVPNLGGGSVYEQISAYAARPEVILKKHFGVHYPDIEVYGASLEVYDTGVYDNETKPQYQFSDKARGQTRLSERDAKKLYRAFVKDVQEGHVAEDREEIGCTVMFDIRDEKGYQTTYSQELEKEAVADIWVGNSYTHMIKALREMGYLK